MKLEKLPSNISRRQVLQGVGIGLIGLSSCQPALISKSLAPPLFKISLAEWSLHRELFSGSLKHLNFAKTAREFGLNAVEYVSTFFRDQMEDLKYLHEMKQIAQGEGIESLLIMCDGYGLLGHPNKEERAKSVRNHLPLLEAAATLGCHSIRVNAASQGSFEEQRKLAVDGLSDLSEAAQSFRLNVIVENHGGLSSNGAWLASVIESVGKNNCGTLPDFGNFKIRGDEWYDRYRGMQELMPFAKAVSAKSHEFDQEGNETKTDYLKMIKIVTSSGYSGHIGIEYEGSSVPEREGITLTKNLLISCRNEIQQKTT